MKIASQISRLFEDRKTADVIVAASDCLECTDEYVDSSWPNQKLFHFKASIIWEWSDKEKSFIQSAIERRDLDLATFHIDACYQNPSIKNRMYQPTGRKYSRSEMLRNAQRNVAWLRSFIPKKSIGVENNNYFPTPAYETVTEGDFISEILCDNGLEFLLDIAHSRITAHNKGIPYDEYFCSLPMENVVQLRVSRHSIEEGIAMDPHDAPDEEVFERIRKIVKRFPAKYLTLEYSREGSRLIKELRRYRTIS